MREDVLIKIVDMICISYVDTILTGIKEQANKFPYTIACANLMSELKEKNIILDFNMIFTDTISDRLFRETSNYLVD